MYTIHINAEKWDKENPNILHPKNRPCNWCGEPVKKGYIHLGKCTNHSRKYWDEFDNPPGYRRYF